MILTTHNLSADDLSVISICVEVYCSHAIQLRIRITSKKGLSGSIIGLVVIMSKGNLPPANAAK